MGQKILFVDDDPHWRDIVSVSFEEAGYQVITAADATEGMSRAEGVGLGLIILDLNLAGEDGLVLMRFMKFNYPDVPILLYTATAQDDEAIRKMLDEGADQYLPKGSVEELLVAAGSYLK